MTRTDTITSARALVSRVPTDDEAMRLYDVAAPNRDDVVRWCEEPSEIIDEMRRVVGASSDRKAADVIRWWDGWGWWQAYPSATACARAIREAWRKMESVETRGEA